MEIKTYDDLLQNSLLVDPKLKSNSNFDGTQEIAIGMDPHDPNFEKSLGTYCVMSDVMAFLDMNGQFYLTPFTTGSEKILKEEKYEENPSLSVPLSHGEKIVHNNRSAKKWEELRSQRKRNANPFYAQEIYEEESRKALLEKSLGEIATAKGLQELPPLFYDLTIDIDSLSYISNEEGEIKTLPKTLMTHDPLLQKSNIGTWNYMSGTIAVIAANGKTYIAPVQKSVEKMLGTSGYKMEESLIVPLTNSETIVEDDVVKTKYDYLRELSKRRRMGNPEMESAYVKSSDEYTELAFRVKELEEALSRASQQQERDREESRKKDLIIERLKSGFSLLRDSGPIVTSKTINRVIGETESYVPEDRIK